MKEPKLGADEFALILLVIAGAIMIIFSVL